MTTKPTAERDAKISNDMYQKLGNTKITTTGKAMYEKLGNVKDRDESIENIMLMIPLFIGLKFGEQVAKAYTDFVEEETYDFEGVFDDFNDATTWDDEECAILEEVADKCELDDEKRKQFWNLMRDFFGIEAVKDVTFSEMEWGSLSNKELEEANAILCEQCFAKVGADQGEAMKRIFAYGLRNNINLLPLLHDVFCYARLQSRMSKKKPTSNVYSGASLKVEQFCKSSAALQELESSQNESGLFGHILKFYDSYEQRLMPAFNFRRMDVIEDQCEIYIDYELALSKALNEIFAKHSKIFPTQVDLAILPIKMGASGGMNSGGFGGGGDDDDDDEDGNGNGNYNGNGNDNDEYKANDNDNDNGPVASIADELLKLDANYNCARSEITRDENAQKIMGDALNAIFSKVDYASRHRFVVVIDRRFGGSAEANDELVVYQLPTKYDILPKAMTENYIFAGANFVLPQAKEESREKYPWVGGKSDKNGVTPMFVLSHHCRSAQFTRLHWFSGGTGIRFSPRFMVSVWPQSFKTADLNKKYSRDYIQKEFGLNCEDPTFETWFRDICGTMKI